MIPYDASVVVKRKRWHDAGVLAPPYVNAKILAPDPHMMDGWVVESEEGRVLHVREAVLPNPLGEPVALELREEKTEPHNMVEPTRRRLTGKQTPTEVPKLDFPSAELQGLCPPVIESAHDDAYEPSIAPLDESPSESFLGIGVAGPKKLFGGETFKVEQETVEKSVEKGSAQKEDDRETEETEIRRMGINTLEKTWNFVHLGLVGIGELKEALKMVPDDEQTGQCCWKVVGFLSKLKGSMERVFWSWKKRKERPMYVLCKRKRKNPQTWKETKGI